MSSALELDYARDAIPFNFDGKYKQLSPEQFTVRVFHVSVNCVQFKFIRDTYEEDSSSQTSSESETTETPPSTPEDSKKPVFPK